jgi:hypothetical protein
MLSAQVDDAANTRFLDESLQFVSRHLSGAIDLAVLDGVQIAIRLHVKIETPDDGEETYHDHRRGPGEPLDRAHEMRNAHAGKLGQDLLMANRKQPEAATIT